MATTPKPPPGCACERFARVIWYWILLAIKVGVYNNLIEIFKRPKTFELPTRSEEVAVITGGTRGIGFETIKLLLQCDFTVILGVRSTDAGEDAVSEMRKSGITGGKTIVLPLDLTSMNSVRTFAEEVLQKTSRLDLLINNAGIMFGRYEETEDGYESQFQVNYLGHFLLTNLLLSRLKETSSKRNSCCRIINISSNAHYGGKLDFTDLEKCKVYADNKSYQDSKLCQVVQAKYLDRMLQNEGSNVRVFAIHPGMIPSGLWVNIVPCINFLLLSVSFLFRTTVHGAWTVMYTALSSELEDKGGSYVNTNETVKPLSTSEDQALQNLLWDRSLQLVDPDYIKTHSGANRGFYTGSLKM